jgi:hypothetical protein
MEYLTIGQESPHAEQWTREADKRGVLLEFGGMDETIELASIGCVLPLAEIYDKVEFG